MGADILGSVLAKIQKTLDLARESFPCENQFNCIIKFLNDPTQTPNTKVKIAVLNYFAALIPQMDPYIFVSRDLDVNNALMKIITWTAMPKSSDLRKCGAQVLSALFTLNPSEYSSFVNGLPAAYKDVAFQLLETEHPRSIPDTPRTPSYVMSPNSSHPWPRSHGGTPQNRSFDLDDTENLNPEELINSWKKTVSEIEEYGFIAGKVSDKINQNSPSQIIVSRHNSLDERFDSQLNSSADSSPSKRSPSDYNNIKFSTEDLCYVSLSENPSEADNEMDEHKAIFSIIDELNQSSRDEKKIIQALRHLVSLTKEKSSIISRVHFRIILREVMEAVEDTALTVRTNALKALLELLNFKSDYFQDYIELTLLKILNAYKDTDFEVIIGAEKCMAVAATKLPPEPCVRTLKALILTGEVPVNQAAIKMLTKIVDKHSMQTVLNLLPEVMPALVKASDHQQSIVRKEAVFCMVAIHSVVGDDMQPHIANLNKTRLKLLNVYIKKAQLQKDDNSSISADPPTSSNP